MRFGFLQHIREKTGHLAFDNLVYNWSLSGGIPDGLTTIPGDTWPGDAEKGRRLCNSGTFTMGGAQQEIHGGCWEPVGISENWLNHMHGFDWLRDLRALGGDAGRARARTMIESWIRHYSSWHAFAWRPDLTGRRIANWISLYEFYGTSADETWQDDFLESLIKQARHLARALSGGLGVGGNMEGLPLFYGIKGMAYAGLAFEGRETWLAQALDLLEKETAKQILSDGGHISRSPLQLLQALQIFMDLRSALQTGAYPVPEQIQHTIDRMTQALRFFRYPDKHFALFNGTQEGDTDLIESVLAKTNTRGKVLSSLPQTGYERMTMGRSLVMMDTGTPPPFPHDRYAHSAPLAFEFVYGRERIFTSCGSHPVDAQWRDVLRGTSAHNDLAIDYRNICEISPDGHFSRKPRKVMVTREKTRDAVLTEAVHDGYVLLNGITHRRRLYLTHQGHDLRGEENLTCTVGLGKPADIILRFHLHPRVLVSLIRDDREALLRLPGGAGWRFCNTGGVLALENSIYLGQGAHPRKTKQLVIYGRMESDHALIKWALRREGC